MKKLILLPILVFFLISFVSAYVYDDFSGEELNLTLWSVEGDMDEYYLDVVEENYHTAQLTPEDRYVILTMLGYNFVEGDVVEYDLDYVSGEGNRMTNIIIDGIQLNQYVGLLGYWNEPQQGGNDFGSHHFRVEFIENGVDIFITKPNNETIQIIQLPQITGTSHTFGIGTRTGNNGIVHMDYDNFVISSEPTIEERVEILEQQVEYLTEQVNILEEGQEEQNERLNLLEIIVDEIQESLNNFIEEITSYLTFTPQEFRQGMVCKYMRENSLTNQTAFGLQCQMFGEDCRCAIS